jgi:hypothetical protein
MIGTEFIVSGERVDDGGKVEENLDDRDDGEEGVVVEVRTENTLQSLAM